MTKSKQAGVDLDAILSELGHFGRYQVQTYCFILLPIIFCAIYNGQYIFNAAATPYRCLVPECENGTEFATDAWGSWALPEGEGQCRRLQPLGTSCQPEDFHQNETVRCTQWVYENDYSIVPEFDLACEEWKRTLVGTIHSVGLFAALPLTGYISDKFGRRAAFLLTAVSPGITGLIRSFSNSYPMYLVMEFIEPTLASGSYSTGFILALEMVGRKWRVLGGNIISCFFAFGQVLLALAAWYVPQWRSLTRLLYVPSLLFIFYIFLIEESVRWLLSINNKKEAARILYKAAAINKKKLSAESIRMLSENYPTDSKKQHNQSQNSEESASSAPKSTSSIARQVIRSKIIMIRLCICSFWWITVTFIYYGLSINSVSLAGNSYVNYMLTSLVEIPGYFLSFLTLDRFGRKKSIVTAFFVCGFSLIALPFIPHSLLWLSTTLTMLGKLCISMTFSSIYIYTSELFPTSARHSLLGFCSMVGRIGSITAPMTPLLVRKLMVLLSKMTISMVFNSLYIYTVELFPTVTRHCMLALCSMIGRFGTVFTQLTPWLMQVMASLPYIIFGVMAGVAGGLMLLTPETLHQELPDTIAQAENIERQPKVQ